jgi:outer membrane murein-binding lipoprotein Lpp
MNIKQRVINSEHRIMSHKLWSSTHIVRYSILCLLSSVLCLYFLAGCESNAAPENPLTKQVDTLTREKREMMRQIEMLESKNKELQKQINTLHDFPDDVSFKDIYEVKRIKITKYTNLYDKDKNGSKETLIVYIQSIDQDGDIIKAPADVNVQLLDLDKDKGPVVLGKWNIKPEQLRKLWIDVLMKTNYRLAFDVSDKIEDPDKPLTVMVTFTDYLTGKVFEEQKLIKPN